MDASSAKDRRMRVSMTTAFGRRVRSACVFDVVCVVSHVYPGIVQLLLRERSFLPGLDPAQAQVRPRIAPCCIPAPGIGGGGVSEQPRKGEAYGDSIWVLVWGSRRSVWSAIGAFTVVSSGVKGDSI